MATSLFLGKMKVLSVPKIPSDELFAKAREFLKSHEKICVSLFCRILRHEVNFFLILDGAKIVGIFSYSDGGQILHCFPDLKENHEKIGETLKAFFSDFDFSKLFSIIGESNGTNLLMNAIYAAKGLIPRFKENHDFLELGNFRFDYVPILKKLPELRIEKANMILFEMLKPIQRAYEEEEVLCGNQEFNELTSNYLLKKALSEENVLVALIGNKIVGKAALNAKGEKYVQIGGVYTLPEFRKKGIAMALLERLIFERKSQGKKIVLFVKKINLPAQKLYESLGFEKFGNFKICYY